MQVFSGEIVYLEGKPAKMHVFFFRTAEIGRFWRNFLYFRRNFLI